VLLLKRDLRRPQNPTGAANQPAADLMGMGSMASQSSAGQQKLPKQEEEEQ